ncbi:MAG: hypothetical protein ACYC7E_04875 [Armatimonadota bacterium]
MPPYLGMYIHTHWGYQHPYAARTWTFEDWRQYASGLSALGYNLLMIWPSTDVMPDPLAPSDHAQLTKMAQVIDMLHDEFRMTVLLTVTPNVIGNDRAGDFAFAERPFFAAERLLNPRDPGERALLFQRRKQHLQYLRRADGVAVIDADPGGYIGSTSDVFADLLLGYLDLTQEINPAMRLYYWMWFGWEMSNRLAESAQGKAALPDGFTWSVPLLDFIALTSPEDYRIAVQTLAGQQNPNWGVLSCFPEHQQTVEALGITDRALFFPYGVIEGEPTFPLTNYWPERMTPIFARYAPERMPLGVMGNAQTHAVQLPNTYAFAHFARGGTLETLDLLHFAEGVFPSAGAPITAAWQAIGGTDWLQMRDMAQCLDALPRTTFRPGPYSGLLFGDHTRFVTDLAMQLRFRADMLAFGAAIHEGTDPMPPLRALGLSWGAWWQRTQYCDCFNGPVRELFDTNLPALHNPEIDAVIADFTSWNVLQHVKQTVMLRLLEAINRIT